jgi:hypothetical protein
VTGRASDLLRLLLLQLVVVVVLLRGAMGRPGPEAAAMLDALGIAFAFLLGLLLLVSLSLPRLRRLASVVFVGLAALLLVSGHRAGFGLLAAVLLSPWVARRTAAPPGDTAEPPT